MAYNLNSFIKIQSLNDLATIVKDKLKTSEGILIEKAVDAIKSVRVDGNTLKFSTTTDTSTTAAFNFDLPAEQFLDQAQTFFEPTFSFSAETYAGATNPNLDGKPVLVLCIKTKSNDGQTEQLNYSFLDVSTLIDIYQASDTSIVVDNYKVGVNVSADSDNILSTTATGLYADGSVKIDKVNGNIGNIVQFVANGEISDTGINATDILLPTTDTTQNNLATFNETGSLKDSGYCVADDSESYELLDAILGSVEENIYDYSARLLSTNHLSRAAGYDGNTELQYSMFQSVSEDNGTYTLTNYDNSIVTVTTDTLSENAVSFSVGDGDSSGAKSSNKSVVEVYITDSYVSGSEIPVSVIKGTGASVSFNSAVFNDTETFITALLGWESLSNVTYNSDSLIFSGVVESGTTDTSTFAMSNTETALQFSFNDNTNVEITYGDIATILANADSTFTNFVELLNQKMADANVTMTVSYDTEKGLTFTNTKAGALDDGEEFSVILTGTGLGENLNGALYESAVDTENKDAYFDSGGTLLLLRSTTRRNLKLTKNVATFSEGILGTGTIAGNAVVFDSDNSYTDTNGIIYKAVGTGSATVIANSLKTINLTWKEILNGASYYDLAFAVNETASNIRLKYNFNQDSFMFYQKKVGVESSLAIVSNNDITAKLLSNMGLKQTYNHSDLATIEPLTFTANYAFSMQGSDLGKKPCIISLSADSDTVNVDLTTTFTVNRDGDGEVIAVSSNTDTATVSVNDNVVTVTGKGAGNAVITVSVAEGTTHFASENVIYFNASVTKRPCNLSLSANSGTVYISSTLKFTVNRNGTGQIIAESSNTDNATVSVSGNTVTVTGKAVGNAVISVRVAESTAFFASEEDVYFNVYSTKRPCNLSLSSTSKTINIDSTTKFTVYRNGNGEISVWSSNSDIASVSLNSNVVTVTSKKAGSAVIYVRVAESSTAWSSENDATFNVSVTKFPLSLSASISSSVTYNTTGTINIKGNTGGGYVTASSDNYYYVNIASSTTDTVTVECNNYSSTAVPITINVAETDRYQSGTVVCKVSTAKATPSITLPTTSLTMNRHMVELEIKTNGSLSASADTGGICRCETGIYIYSSCKLRLYSVGIGTTKVNITMANPDNFKTKITKTITVTSPPLNILDNEDTNTLAKLRSVIKAGDAPFKLGDYFYIPYVKDIDIDNDDGRLWIRDYELLKAVCIGIAHNSEYEGWNRVHFAIDSGFIGVRMNTTDTNKGGWNSSRGKAWLNGTFYNALPTELKNVITACYKYTDNTGQGSNTSAKVTRTSQKIWLLSEYERFGKITYANPHEADSPLPDKQLQYDFFKKGLSLEYGDTWLRSPTAKDNSYNSHKECFCYDNEGSFHYFEASIRQPVAPCFTIS